MYLFLCSFILRFLMAGIVLPHFAGRNSGCAAPVQGIRQVTFGGTNGVLWPQKYNLLGKSCSAGHCHPRFFFAPKLPWEGASGQNAQHYSSRNVSFWPGYREHPVIGYVRQDLLWYMCMMLFDCVEFRDMKWGVDWFQMDGYVGSSIRKLSGTLSDCPTTGGKRKYGHPFFLLAKSLDISVWCNSVMVARG